MRDVHLQPASLALPLQTSDSLLPEWLSALIAFCGKRCGRTIQSEADAPPVSELEALRANTDLGVSVAGILFRRLSRQLEENGSKPTLARTDSSDAGSEGLPQSEALPGLQLRTSVVVGTNGELRLTNPLTEEDAKRLVVCD